MKIFAAPVLAVVLAAASPSMAADKMQHMDHSMHGKAEEAALADGLVKKVDKAGGKLTVSHGPLPNGMPAMTMAFRVKDASWLSKVKEGDKIRFAIQEVEGAMTIVRLEPAK